MDSCSASYTTPIPPRPISPNNRKSPSSSSRPSPMAAPFFRPPRRPDCELASPNRISISIVGSNVRSCSAKFGCNIASCSISTDWPFFARSIALSTIASSSPSIGKSCCNPENSVFISKVSRFISQELTQPLNCPQMPRRHRRATYSQHVRNVLDVQLLHISKHQKLAIIRFELRQRRHHARLE